MMANDHYRIIQLDENHRIVLDYDDETYDAFRNAEEALDDTDWAVRVTGSSYRTDIGHNADDYDELVSNGDKWDQYHGALRDGSDWATVDIAVRNGVYGSGNDAETVFHDAEHYYSGDVFTLTLEESHRWTDENGNVLTEWDSVTDGTIGDCVFNDLDDDTEVIDLVKFLWPNEVNGLI